MQRVTMIEYYLRAYHNFLFLSFHSCSKGKLFEHGKIRTMRTIPAGILCRQASFFSSSCNAYMLRMDVRNEAKHIAPANSLYVYSLCVHIEQKEEKKKEGKKSKFVLYSYFRINHATCIFYAFFIYYYLLLDTFRFLFFYFNFFNFYMVILV